MIAELATSRRLDAFNLGWDHAIYGVDVPESADKDFCDGYLAARKGHPKPRPRDKFIRKWLQIRFGALQRGKSFSDEITPEYLEMLVPDHGRCPVSWIPLTCSSSTDTDWSVDRANNELGYIPGNLILVSRKVNEAKADKQLEQIVALGELSEPSEGLSPEEWRRLAVLIRPAFSLREDGTVEPVRFLDGSEMAPGTLLGSVAHFQLILSMLASGTASKEGRKLAGQAMASIELMLCRNKQQRRALFQLWKAVIARIPKVSRSTAIWETWRLQRKLALFLKELGEKGMTMLGECFGSHVLKGKFANTSIWRPEDEIRSGALGETTTTSGNGL